LYVLLVLYSLYIRWRLYPPDTPSEARHYRCCRRLHQVQVNGGKLSRSLRMGRGPIRYERDAPTHAGSLLQRPPFFIGRLQARWRALASHIYIRAWEYLYRRTHPSKSLRPVVSPTAFRCCGGTPLEEVSAGGGITPI
jgi:hypothetical protein